MNLDSVIPTEQGLCSDLFGLRVHISEQTKCKYIHSCIDNAKEHRFLLFLDGLIFFLIKDYFLLFFHILSLQYFTPKGCNFIKWLEIFFFQRQCRELSKMFQSQELLCSKKLFMVKRKSFTKIVIII